MSDSNRKFNLEDAFILEHASNVISYLPIDIEDFKGFNKTFGQESIDELKTLWNEANSTKADNELEEELAQLTYIVNRKIHTCFEAYKTVGYFVRKVFKDDIIIQNQFGLNDISEFRNNHAQMIVSTRLMAETVNKYQLGLIVGGMSESFVASLPILHCELFEANNKLEMFKREREKLIQDRVGKINDLYNQLVPISDAAKEIYAGNPVQLDKYVLPDTPPGDEE